MIAKAAAVDRSELAESYRQAKGAGGDDRLARHWKRRWQRAEEMAAWLSEAALPALTLEQGRALYRASGGNQSRDFAANPLTEIRDVLDFLLYDSITLEARFNECVSAAGAYKLDGAGKEFVSYLLCLRQPGLLAAWNPAAERSLRRLGLYPRTMARGHWGLRYLDLLDALQQVRTQYGLSDYREVDQFCYFLSRRAAKEKPAG